MRSAPLTTDPVVNEFQARRHRASRAVRPWIASVLVGFGSMALGLSQVPIPGAWCFWLVIGGFTLSAVSIGGMNLVTSHHYRCPWCEQMPITRYGLILDPDTCPRCSVALR